jgi:hypothetical protein
MFNEKLTELSLLFSLLLSKLDGGRAFDSISAKFVPLSPVSLDTPISSANRKKEIKNENSRGWRLTFDVCESAEHSPGTIARLLYIVTFGALVYFRMKLLFCSSVTIGTHITCITIARFSPFLAVFYIRTRRRSGNCNLVFLASVSWSNPPIFEFPRASSFIFAVVILWAGVALPA